MSAQARARGRSGFPRRGIAWGIRYQIPVVFEPSTDAAAIQVERWAHYCLSAGR